jgi:hypothetical protein
MKYVIFALLVTGALNVFATGETKTEVCTKVEQSSFCKGQYKKSGDKCVNADGKEVKFDDKGNATIQN